MKRLAAGLSLLALLALLAGCATAGREESDLPWNMTQPWESAPTLPFSAY